MKKKEKDLYREWIERVENLITRKRSLHLKYLRWYRLYRIQPLVNSDSMTVNVVFTNIQLVKALLYYLRPYFRVRPTTRVSDADRAQLQEEVLNIQWARHGGHKNVKRVIVDGEITGVGWLRISHGTLEPLNFPPKPGSLTFKRVSPFDIYTELDNISLEECTYFVERVRYPTRWLNKLFPKAEFQPDTLDFEATRRFGTTKHSPSKTTFYQIQDLIEGKLLLLSPQQREVLLETELEFREPMYIPLVFAEDPERSEAISETGIIEPQQIELNNIRTQQHIHRKRFNRRYIANKSLFEDEAELKKVERGEDGTIAFVNEVEGAIKPIEDAPLPTDLQVYQMDIKTDLREMFGINEWLKAGVIPRTKTAYESSQISQGTQLRSHGRADELNDFLIQAARTTMSLLQHYEIVDRHYIQTEEGERLWTREDMLGDYEVEVEVGSTLPPNPIPYELLLRAGQPGNVVGGSMTENKFKQEGMM